MKMLKVISSMLAVMLLISGCGCAKNETNEQASGETNAAITESQDKTATDDAASEGSASGSESGSESGEAASDDGKISIDLTNAEKTPKYYWDAQAEGDKNILYHNEGCPNLTEAATPINLGLAQSIGLRQCPECQPEKYEGYAE